MFFASSKVAVSCEKLQAIQVSCISGECNRNTSLKRVEIVFCLLSVSSASNMSWLLGRPFFITFHLTSIALQSGYAFRFPLFYFIQEIIFFFLAVKEKKSSSRRSQQKVLHLKSTVIFFFECLGMISRWLMLPYYLPEFGPKKSCSLISKYESILTAVTSVLSCLFYFIVILQILNMGIIRMIMLKKIWRPSQYSTLAFI